MINRYRKFQLFIFLLHLRISHATIAVKKVDTEYTSASTALNQCESVTAKVKLAINALRFIIINFEKSL